MTEPHGPLQGVKVVACSTAQAGTVPYMLMADLGAEVIKIEVPEVGDNSRGSTVLPGLPQHLFRNQQPRREERHAEPEDPGRPRDPAQAGRDGGHLRPEFPPRRGGEERLRLRGAAEGQPEARLYLDLGLRPQRAACRSARHRFDGAGARRHRRGLFDAGPAAEYRHRLRRRRNLRHPGVWRRARGADPRAQPPASARRSIARCSAARSA